MNPRFRKGSMFWHKKWFHFSLVLLGMALYGAVRGIFFLADSDLGRGIPMVLLAVFLFVFAGHIFRHYFRMKKARDRKTKRAAERKLINEVEAIS